MDRSAGVLKLSRRLDDIHRVVRYDRRGYGRSRPHPGPFGMEPQVEDLVGVLGGRPAVVFGHSYGGNVALALATQRPELVSAVAVYETPLSWLDWWPGSTAGADALATRGDPADAAERFMRRLVGDERWGRLPAATREARREEGVAMVGELTDLGERPPWNAAAVTMPVVAMHGSRGADHHRLSTTYLADVLPDCRVVRDRGCAPFRAQHPPGRGRRGDRRDRQSANGVVTVTSRPRNVQVVSSKAPACSVSPTWSAQSCSDSRCDHTTAASAPRSPITTSLPMIALTIQAATTASTSTSKIAIRAPLRTASNSRPSTATTVGHGDPRLAYPRLL